MYTPNQNLLDSSVIFCLSHIQWRSNIQIDCRSLFLSNSEHRMFLPLDPKHLHVELIAVVIVDICASDGQCILGLNV